MHCVRAFDDGVIEDACSIRSGYSYTDLETSNVSMSEPDPPSRVANIEILKAVAAFRFLANNIKYTANELGIGAAGDPPRSRKSSCSAH